MSGPPDQHRPREGSLSRRDLLRRAGALGLLASAGGTLLAACGGEEAAAPPPPAPAEPAPPPPAPPAETAPATTAAPVLEDEVNIIAWSQEWEFAVEPFQQESGVKVNVTFRADEPLNQVIGSNPGTFDLVSYTPLGGDSPLIDEGLFQGLDVERIEAWNDYEPALREILEGAWGGQIYCAPYYFGGTFLVRNTDLVGATDTWEALWDPANKNKTAVVDSGNDVFLYFATTLGLPPTDFSDENLAAAEPLAQDLVRNVRTFWSTGDDIRKFVAQGDVGLTDMWDGTALELVKKGEPIETIIPTQGTVGWIDGPGLVVDAPHPNAAYAWINYVLRPEAGVQLAEEFSFVPANSAAFELLSPETAELLQIETVQQAFASGLYIFDRAVSADADRKVNDWWEQVKLSA